MRARAGSARSCGTVTETRRSSLTTHLGAASQRERRRPPASARERRPPARSRGSGRRPASADSTERALELLEEALVGLVRVLAGAALELGEQLALLRREAFRNRDVDHDPVLTAAEALEHRHPLAAQHANLAGLRSGLELERDLAV